MKRPRFNNNIRFEDKMKWREDLSVKLNAA